MLGKFSLNNFEYMCTHPDGSLWMRGKLTLTGWEITLEVILSFFGLFLVLKEVFWKAKKLDIYFTKGINLKNDVMKVTEIKIYL